MSRKKRDAFDCSGTGVCESDTVMWENMHKLYRFSKMRPMSRLFSSNWLSQQQSQKSETTCRQKCLLMWVQVWFVQGQLPNLKCCQTVLMGT